MNRKANTIRNHIIFWLAYVVLWGIRDLIYNSNVIHNIFLNLGFALSAAPFVYFNLYYLIPRYLLKKKWFVYVSFFLLGFGVSFYLRYYMSQLVLKDISGALEAAQRFNSGEGYVILASENIVLIMITMALFLIRNWYENEKYTHELEQKNTNTELTLLKSQLQPHFLFNNLNTIYFMMEKNPLLAKEMMIWSADVLSHQLYNAQKDTVLLKDELDSLEKFLKIQRVRHEDFLKLSYSFTENIGVSKIAPMILFTFIENAFKHGQREGGYSIDITVKLQDSNLHLMVINTMGDKREGNHGVGLENVKRRLALLYPDKHILQMEESTETYTVNLMISLDKNEQI